MKTGGRTRGGQDPGRAVAPAAHAAARRRAGARGPFRRRSGESMSSVTPPARRRARALRSQYGVRRRSCRLAAYTPHPHLAEKERDDALLTTVPPCPAGQARQARGQAQGDDPAPRPIWVLAPFSPPTNRQIAPYLPRSLRWWRRLKDVRQTRSPAASAGRWSSRWGPNCRLPRPRCDLPGPRPSRWELPGISLAISPDPVLSRWAPSCDLASWRTCGSP